MSLGFGQILIITILIFIIFGAGKLPLVMSDLAKGIRAFKKGMAGDGDDTHSQLTTTQTEKKTVTPSPSLESDSHSPHDS